MDNKNFKSFNHQVFQKAYQRLNLKKRERVIFQRLLGFLIRNNKPFPYAVPTLSELTEYGESSIFEALNILEKYRLIVRIGMGKNRRFRRGSILDKILTTVQNRSKVDLVNNSTTVQILDEKTLNSPESGYSKTSSLLKHKERGVFSIAEIQEKAWYEKNPDVQIKKEHLYLFEIINID